MDFLTDTLSIPIQETGDRYSVESGGTTVEKSTITKWQNTVDYKASVEEVNRSPDDLPPVSGITDSNIPITKVSTGTQTEMELLEQNQDVKPESEMEKESDIKEMSTQTLPEANDQPASELEAKGKKKKHRPKRRRSSKDRRKKEEEEEEEDKLIVSSDDLKSRSKFMQFPKMPDNILWLVIPLFLFFYSPGMAECSLVNNVNEQWHAYSFVTNYTLVGLNVHLKRGLKDMCIIKIEAETSMDCNGSTVYQINNTMLLLVTKETKKNFILETAEWGPTNSKYEGAFSDPKSALKTFALKSPSNTTSGHTLSWSAIAIILISFLVVGVATALLLHVNKKRYIFKQAASWPTVIFEKAKSDDNLEQRNGTCVERVPETGLNTSPEAAPIVQN